MRTLTVLVLICCPLSAAYGQNRATVDSVLALQRTAGGGTLRIEVEFDREFGSEADAATAERSEHYRLIDVGATPVQEIGIESATVRALGRRGNKARSSLVVLLVKQTITDTPPGRYVMRVSDVRFAGGGTMQPWSGSVSFGARDAGTEDLARRVIDQADARDDADFYFAGEAGRSAGTDFFGAVDVKMQYPVGYFVSNDQVHTLSPTFDLRASSAAGADPNSARLGLRWGWSPFTGLPRVLAVRWENSGELESARDFDTANIVWVSQLTAISDMWQNEQLAFYARPFIGVDAGGNVAADVGTGSDPGALLRTAFGTTAVFKIRVLQGVSFEAAAERRHLHRDEVLDGTGLGKGARDWLEAKLNFAFTGFWGAFVGFEDGRKPPEFQDVRNRLRFGFSYKAKVAVK
jgi:hypothetical protein